MFLLFRLVEHCVDRKNFVLFFADKTVPEIQDPESLVIDNSTKSQACPAGFLCKACGKVQQISNRYTYQRHLKLDALHKAYVKLHDVQFA